jgi:hypothetical protein
MGNGVRSGIWESVRDALNRPDRLFGLWIDGVEVTQAIQYQRAPEHLTDPTDRGPDNSIRLVADKPAYVRVYVRNLWAATGVTGRITVQKRRLGMWRDVGTLPQRPPGAISVALSPSYDSERGSLGRSLNFVIPSATMRGLLRLKVHVELSGGTRSADSTVSVDASMLQTLRVRAIPVRYWGPDAAGNPVQLAAPTLADFQTTAARTLRLYPVSQTPDIGLAGTFTWSNPLTGNITTNNGTSSCPTSWGDLLFWLRIAKMVDGNRADRLYYALLPAGIPVGQAGGCGGGGGVGAGFVNSGQTMAHELGHILDLSHAPCGLVTGDMGDPNYPAYEPYDTANKKTASIGEYGIDPTTETVYSPAFDKDVMSYCATWISLYHYEKLLGHARLDPTWVSDSGDSLPPFLDDRFRDPVPHHLPDPPPPWVGRRIGQLAEPDPVPLVVLTGIVREDQLEIRSVLRLVSGPTPVGRRVHGTVAELLDEQGDVLERAPLRWAALEATCGGCTDGEHAEPPEGIVQALLPDPDRVASLRVVRDGEELWSRRAPSQALSMGEVTADVEGPTLRLRWSIGSSADDYPLERVVRWSADEGRTWQALVVGLTEDEAAVPLSGLTAGRDLVQVLVSDGFHTVASPPVWVDVPERPPEVAILWPTAGSTVRSGSAVRMWGVATASDGRSLQDAALSWELDGESVGVGTEVWSASANGDGEHRATLRATDGDLSAEASVTFLAAAP